MRRLLLPKQMYLMDTNAACDLRPCRTAHKIDRLKLERFSLSLSICVSLFMYLCVRLCLLVFLYLWRRFHWSFSFFFPLSISLSLCVYLSHFFIVWQLSVVKMVRHAKQIWWQRRHLNRQWANLQHKTQPDDLFENNSKGYTQVESGNKARSGWKWYSKIYAHKFSAKGKI